MCFASVFDPCKHVFRTDEQLIIRSNRDILPHQINIFFTKAELKFIVLPLLFDGFSLMASFSLAQMQQLFSQLFPHHSHSCCCQAFLRHHFCSHFPFWQLQSHLSSLWIKPNLAGTNAILQSAMWLECRSTLTAFHLMLALDYHEVSRFLTATVCKQDSSTSNLIYQGWQLLMQSFKPPCNSITKRLAPGPSLFRA